MNPYSDSKILRDLKRLQAIRDGKTFPPKQVEIVLSDLCNQDCWFCMYRQSGMLPAEKFGGNPARFLDTTDVKKLLHEIVEMGVRAVLFSGGGEPTVHPQHLTIFKEALDLGLACGLITNGTLLRGGWENVLPYFTWIRVSLDAGTEATYAATRKVSGHMFKRVLANLANLRYEIDQRNTNCYLGVGFVVTPENYQECAWAARHVHQEGAHSIRFNPVRTPLGTDAYDGILESVLASLHRAKTLPGLPIGFVLEQFTSRLEDLEGPPDYPVCHYQKLAPFVGADGKVYRCCHTSYSNRGYLGELQSFEALWYGEDVQKRMREFDARGCENCTFNRINRAVELITKPGTPHEEFL